MILREVIEGEEFLSLSSEQEVKLISSDKRIVPSEKKVGKLKLVIDVFKYYARARRF